MKNSDYYRFVAPKENKIHRKKIAADPVLARYLVLDFFYDEGDSKRKGMSIWRIGWGIRIVDGSVIKFKRHDPVILHDSFIELITPLLDDNEYLAETRIRTTSFEGLIKLGYLDPMKDFEVSSLEFGLV